MRELTRKLRIGGAKKIKSKSRSIRRPVGTISFKKAATYTPFSKRISSNVLGKLYNNYKVTQKMAGPNKILRASVKVAKAEATNLLILYRQLLVIKLYYSKNMAYLNDESNNVIIEQLDKLRIDVLKSLRYIFSTGPVSLKTIKDHKDELKDISSTYAIPTFRNILTELTQENTNNAMNSHKEKLQKEIENDELGDELLGAFADLKVNNDEAVSELFAGLKL